MSAFTPREVAYATFAEVRNTGRGRVLGVPADEVRVARLETCRRAENRILAAVGTPRMFSREPDDTTLDAMLAGVRERIAELEAAPAEPARTGAQPAAERLIGRRTWHYLDSGDLGDLTGTIG